MVDQDNPRADIEWRYDVREALACPDCGRRVGVASSDSREVSGVRRLDGDAEMEQIAARR